MPSQPPDNFERQFDFTDFSLTQPAAQQPGDKIDLELDEARVSINQTISRLNEIQRDDGKLRDGIFDFTPMNNAVIEAQAARDDAVAAKVEAVAAKDYVTDVATDLTASVSEDAESAATSAASALASKNLAQSAAAVAVSNSSAAAGFATDAFNSAGDAENSATAAATSATSAANSLTSITTGLLSKLTNSISWTGAYDNGVTYQAGDGVIFGGEYFVLKAYIGAAGYSPGSHASSWTRLIPAGVGGNPFDQTLNTDSYATFSGAAINNDLNVSGTIYLGAVGSLTQGTLTLSEGGAPMVVSHENITFPDATVQTTAAITNQSLLQSDQVKFNTITVESPMGASIVINPSNITFNDDTIQYTAFPPAGGTSAQYIAGDGTLITFPTLATANKLTATVSNQTGSVLTKGQVVYINGTHGNLPTVALAQANAESTSAGTYGFVAADIGNNSTGTIVIAGVVENLATNLLADGDKIYLSPTTPGGYTTTKPYAPNHLVYLGVVTRAHPSLGTIQLRITNGFELEELHNVQAQAPANGDGIFFDDSDDQWKTASVVSKVPAASTTVAGKVELATEAEAIAGTSTTLAVTPSTAAKEITRRLARRRVQTQLTALSSQVTGTGVGFSQVQLYANRTTPSAGVAGFSRGYCVMTQTDTASSLDWSKPIGFGVFGTFSNAAAHAGIDIRIGLGYTSSPTAGVELGDLAVRGFGFFWANGGNVFLQVHDGTTLRNIDTGFTPQTSGTAWMTYLEAFSDGAGDVTAYIRVSQSTTGGASTEYTVSSANGPTGANAIAPNNGFLYQVTSDGINTAQYNSTGQHQTFFYD